MTRPLLTILARVLFAAGGPDGGDSPPVEPDPDAEIVLGTGEWQWEDVGSLQELTLSRGVQGGYHVWLSVRARGVDPERIRMVLTLLPSVDDSLRVRSDIRIDLDPPADPVVGEDGWFEYIGFPAQLSRPWCVVDAPLTATVMLEDQNGITISDQVEIIPIAPAAGLPVECTGNFD